MPDEGWVCPKCQRVLAPTVRECPHCAPVKQTEDPKPPRLDYWS